MRQDTENCHVYRETAPNRENPTILVPNLLRIVLVVDVQVQIYGNAMIRHKNLMKKWLAMDITMVLYLKMATHGLQTSGRSMIHLNKFCIIKTVIMIGCSATLGIMVGCTSNPECASGSILITQATLGKVAAVTAISKLPGDFNFTEQELLLAVSGVWKDTLGNTVFEIHATVVDSITYNASAPGAKCGPTQTISSFVCSSGTDTASCGFTTGAELQNATLSIQSPFKLFLLYSFNKTIHRHELLVSQVYPGGTRLPLTIGQLLVKS
jgi:hypothetical protein